jgi:hypothetical protein
MFAKLFPLTIAAALTLGTLASADSIPDHTKRTIRLSVTSADAIVLATLMDAPEDGPHARAKFKVNQVLMGTVGTDLDLPLDGFYAPELEPGTQLIISLKQISGANRFICNGRYERVIEGQVRDFALDTYISAVTADVAKVQAVRSVANAQKRSPATKPTVASNSGT